MSGHPKRPTTVCQMLLNAFDDDRRAGVLRQRPDQLGQTVLPQRSAFKQFRLGYTVRNSQQAITGAQLNGAGFISRLH